MQKKKINREKEILDNCAFTLSLQNIVCINDLLCRHPEQTFWLKKMSAVSTIEIGYKRVRDSSESQIYKLVDGEEKEYTER